MSEMEEKWAGVLSDSPRLKAYKKYVGDWEEKIGSLLEFDTNRVVESSAKEGPLAGIPFGVKDNIAVKNYKLTCGSKMLEHLVSPYTATAVIKLQEAGAVPVAKCNLDEFGMGSSTDNSALGKTSNPWDTERVAGGILRGECGGCSGWSCSIRPGVRYGRIRSSARFLLRCLRVETDIWRCIPIRFDSLCFLSGSYRSAGPYNRNDEKSI